MDKPWQKPHRPVSEDLTPAQRKITKDFTSIAERDQWMLDNATHFVVGRRLGPRAGYERHEVPTLPEALKLARRLANKAHRPIMVYAVVAPYDALITTVKPDI